MVLEGNARNRCDHPSSAPGRAILRRCDLPNSRRRSGYDLPRRNHGRRHGECSRQFDCGSIPTRRFSVSPKNLENLETNLVTQTWKVRGRRDVPRTIHHHTFLPNSQFPPTPPIHSTSPVSIQVICRTCYTCTVIYSRAIVHHVSQAKPALLARAPRCSLASKYQARTL